MKKQAHAPYTKFKGELTSRNLTYKDIADFLNVTETTVSHKVTGPSDFGVTEIRRLEIEFGIPMSAFM